jgi:chromosome segregation ATPase
MRTREKSKAQLMREVKALNEELAAVRNAEQLSAAILKDADKKASELQSDLKRVRDNRDQFHKAMHELKLNNRGLEGQVEDLQRQLKEWKGSYMEMHERMKRMRKNFFQQAALAGELADNAFATVAPVSYTDAEALQPIC